MEIKMIYEKPEMWIISGNHCIFTLTNNGSIDYIPSEDFDNIFA